MFLSLSNGIIKNMTTDKMANTLSIATEAFAKHGLTGWKFEIDHAKRRAGVCRFDKSTISLAEGYIQKATDSEIKNTMSNRMSHHCMSDSS